MPNPFEKIAEKEKQKANAKQNADVERFAQKIAEQLVGVKVDVSLKDSVAELATYVAEAIVVSNHEIDEKINKNFTQLLSAVKENKPDSSSQIDLSMKIAESLVSLDSSLANLDMSPIVNVSGLSHEQLKAELAAIVNLLPTNSKRVVSIAYDNATPDKFLNVRLTDGINFYKASGIGGGSGGSVDVTGLATSAKQDEMITAIGNIGGSTNYTTRIETVGTLTYIGNAVIGSATSGALWQIKRLDSTSGLIKLWADGNDNFDNIWDNRASLSYS